MLIIIGTILIYTEIAIFTLTVTASNIHNDTHALFLGLLWPLVWFLVIPILIGIWTSNKLERILQER